MLKTWGCEGEKPCDPLQVLYHPKHITLYVVLQKQIMTLQAIV